MKHDKPIRFALAAFSLLFAWLCIRVFDVEDEGWHSFFIGIVGGCFFVPITRLGVVRAAAIALSLFVIFVVVPPSESPYVAGNINTDSRDFIGTILGLAVAELASQVWIHLRYPRRPRI